MSKRSVTLLEVLQDSVLRHEHVQNLLDVGRRRGEPAARSATVTSAPRP